jgi:hypothetical protein
VFALATRFQPHRQHIGRRARGRAPELIGRSQLRSMRAPELMALFAQQCCPARRRNKLAQMSFIRQKNPTDSTLGPRQRALCFPNLRLPLALCMRAADFLCGVHNDINIYWAPATIKPTSDCIQCLYKALNENTLLSLLMHAIATNVNVQSRTVFIQFDEKRRTCK